MAKFKVGDWIIVTNRQLTSFGERGRITKINELLDVPYQTLLESVDYTLNFKASSIKLDVGNAKEIEQVQTWLTLR